MRFQDHDKIRAWATREKPKFPHTWRMKASKIFRKHLFRQSAKIPLFIHAMFAKFPYVWCVKTSILFRSLPITSVTSALFQWASLIMSIFSIYTIPHFTIYVFRSYTTTRTMSPCKPYICHFKAFNLYIEQDIGVMLKACQRTFWSRLDGLECCGCPEEPQEDNYITMSAISLCYWLLPDVIHCYFTMSAISSVRNSICIHFYVFYAHKLKLTRTQKFKNSSWPPLKKISCWPGLLKNSSWPGV